MKIIINSPVDNIYKDFKEYSKKRTEKAVVYKGVKYAKKIVYERHYTLLQRVVIGSFAYLSMISIIPLYFSRKQVMNYWKQAVKGFDKIVVLIRESNTGLGIDRDQGADTIDFAMSSPCTTVYEKSILLPEAQACNKTLFPYEQKRKIPPLGVMDTRIMVDGKWVSEHGTGELFCDREIVQKLQIMRREAIAADFYAEFTEHGKAIIQQRAMRGCTAAATAMLIVDNGKKIDPYKLEIRNLANEERQIRDIEEAGLKAIINSAETLSELRLCIVKNGSAIVSVDNKIGAHVVIVDEVSEDHSWIRLRDPYHGWEITVTKEAFLQEWKSGNVIQVSKS